MKIKEKTNIYFDQKITYRQVQPKNKIIKDTHFLITYKNH